LLAESGAAALAGDRVISELAGVLAGECRLPEPPRGPVAVDLGPFLWWGGALALCIWLFPPVGGRYPLLAAGLLVLSVWYWAERRQSRAWWQEDRAAFEQRGAELAAKAGRRAASVYCHRCGVAYDPRTNPSQIWHQGR